MAEEINASLDFMNQFLITFTKEIVRNTTEYQNQIQILQVNELVTKKEKAIENKVKQIEKTEASLPLQQAIKPMTIPEIVKAKLNKDKTRVTELKNIQSGVREANPFKNFFEQRAREQRTRPQFLKISEPRLPPTVSYLKPTPTNLEINIGKLNVLVKDPLVSIIECNGPNENVIVVGAMGRKKTPIILTKEEIEETLQTFSEATKIPVQEGISKIVYGKLILSAIVSEIIGSKFTIKKMSAPPVQYK